MRGDASSSFLQQPNLVCEYSHKPPSRDANTDSGEAQERESIAARERPARSQSVTIEFCCHVLLGAAASC
eukprot:scaffold768_cov166-Amphora_coffeaeformis.AAC.6